LLLTRRSDDESVDVIVGVTPPLLWIDDPSVLPEYGDLAYDQLAASESSIFGRMR
jgi:hypothetical protein